MKSTGKLYRVCRIIKIWDVVYSLCISKRACLKWKTTQELLKRNHKSNETSESVYIKINQLCNTIGCDIISSYDHYYMVAMAVTMIVLSIYEGCERFANISISACKIRDEKVLVLDCLYYIFRICYQFQDKNKFKKKLSRKLVRILRL